MSNMVHDKYVQQRGICTCTHIANKCHKYFTDSIKKFAVSNTNQWLYYSVSNKVAGSKHVNRTQVLLHPSSISTVF